jgi:hypothetical protein
MGKAKPKLILYCDLEWVEDKGHLFTTHFDKIMMRKKCLKCCLEGETQSDLHNPFYFYDKHYPETNGYYECEIVEEMVGTTG